MIMGNICITSASYKDQVDARSINCKMMNMIRKGQMQGVVRGDVGGQIALIAKLFGIVA